MISNVAHKIMSSIHRHWNIIENFLYYPTKVPEFERYLNNYRGLSNSYASNIFKKNELAKSAGEGVVNFFVNIFAIEGLADLDPKNIELVLCEVEKNVNLALYYWFGLNDRNYQFRTWIHFFGLEGVGSIFLTKEKCDYSVTLSENGIRFGLSTETRFPVILPVSKVLVFNRLPGDLLAPVEFTNEKEVFARLRTIQREVCLLIDEWEYQNSILAVEYAQSLRSLQNNQDNLKEDSHQLVLKKMDIKRNFFASFGIEALCDFQEWVNFICKKNTNGDIAAEIDALCALMLSSLQKFFLPASISRLVYKNDMILLCQRFIKARLEYCPEDFSASLALQATQSAQGDDFNSSLFHILKSKSYEWKLCFDPSPAMKAFSWAYSKKHHVLLCSLMGICYFKKCHSSHLDDVHLCDLVSTYQVQDSFLSYLKREPLHENTVSVLNEDIKELTASLLNYLSTQTKESKQNLDYVNTIQLYLDTLSLHE